MTNPASTRTSAAQARLSPHPWRSRMPAAQCWASRLRLWPPTTRTRATSAPLSPAGGFDVEKVDMAIGFDNSSVALAVEQLAAEHNRIAIAGAVGSTAFAGKACTPTEASWISDSYALTTGLARSVVAEGRDTLFFLTVDYAFGHRSKPMRRARCSQPAARCLALSTRRISISYLL
jgi:substrate-binding family protein